MRHAVLRIGQRIDAETATPEGANAEIERMKLPRAHRVECNHPLSIELDAGYICSNDRSKKGLRWFSATVARLVGTEGACICHGFVREEITFPAGRLEQFLAHEGIGDAAALAVISEGGEDVLGAGYFQYRASQQLLYWFHVAMCFRYVWQALGSIDRAMPEGRYTFRTIFESVKWRLWHFQPVYCFSKLGYLSQQLEHCRAVTPKHAPRNYYATITFIPMSVFLVNMRIVIVQDYRSRRAKHSRP